MKLANISLSVMTLLLAAAPAMSADLSVQGQVITSQGTVSSGKTEFTDAAGTTSTDDNGGKSKSITAPGVGVNAQYHVTDRVSVGGGLAWVYYDGGKEKGQYNDFSVAANGSYDFLKLDALALYGTAGISYHLLDPKDQKNDLVKQDFKSADLLNYDLGVGARYELVKNVNLGLAYRFSDTLAKGTFDSTAVIATESSKTKAKDIGLQQNELIASVGYS